MILGKKPMLFQPQSLGMAYICYKHIRREKIVVQANCIHH